MEKMPDRYICNFCGHITSENHEICPTCLNNKPIVYGRKLKQKKSFITDPNFNKKFGQMR